MREKKRKKKPSASDGKPRPEAWWVLDDVVAKHMKKCLKGVLDDTEKWPELCPYKLMSALHRGFSRLMEDIRSTVEEAERNR